MEDEINDEQENENSVPECNVYEGQIEVEFSLETEFERTAREKREHFQQGNFIFFILYIYLYILLIFRCPKFHTPAQNMTFAQLLKHFIYI